jgi:hypothetical protein
MHPALSLSEARAPRAALACTWRRHSTLRSLRQLSVVPLGREREQAAHCAQPHERHLGVMHQRHGSPSVTVQAVTVPLHGPYNSQN